LLGAMVLAKLELSVGVLARRLGRQVACVGGAAALGAIAHYAIGETHAWLRLTLTAGVVMTSGAALLAVFDGFSPRAIVRSLRG